MPRDHPSQSHSHHNSRHKSSSQYRSDYYSNSEYRSSSYSSSDNRPDSCSNSGYRTNSHSSSDCRSNSEYRPSSHSRSESRANSHYASDSRYNPGSSSNYQHSRSHSNSRYTTDSHSGSQHKTSQLSGSSRLFAEPDPIFEFEWVTLEDPTLADNCTLPKYANRRESKSLCIDPRVSAKSDFTFPKLLDTVFEINSNSLYSNLPPRYIYCSGLRADLSKVQIYSLFEGFGIKVVALEILHNPETGKFEGKVSVEFAERVPPAVFFKIQSELKKKEEEALIFYDDKRGYWQRSKRRLNEEVESKKRNNDRNAKDQCSRSSKDFHYADSVNDFHEKDSNENAFEKHGEQSFHSVTQPQNREEQLNWQHKGIHQQSSNSSRPVYGSTNIKEFSNQLDEKSVYDSGNSSIKNSIAATEGTQIETQPVRHCIRLDGFNISDENDVRDLFKDYEILNILPLSNNLYVNLASKSQCDQALVQFEDCVVLGRKLSLNYSVLDSSVHTKSSKSSSSSSSLEMLDFFQKSKLIFSTEEFSKMTTEITQISQSPIFLEHTQTIAMHPDHATKKSKILLPNSPSPLQKAPEAGVIKIFSRLVPFADAKRLLCTKSNSSELSSASKFEQDNLPERRKSRVQSYRSMLDAKSSLQNLLFRAKRLKLTKSCIHAFGIFAMEPIEANAFVIEYVGELVRNRVADMREYYLYSKNRDACSYLFRIDAETVVDATIKGNLARFMNHSCDPNCTAKVINVNGEKKICVYAKRDIAVGQEITYDYKFPLEAEKLPCFCGAFNCRGSLN